MRPSSPLLDSVRDLFEGHDQLAKDFTRAFHNSDNQFNNMLFDVTFLVGSGKEKCKLYGVRAILGVRSSRPRIRHRSSAIPALPLPLLIAHPDTPISHYTTPAHLHHHICRSSFTPFNQYTTFHDHGTTYALLPPPHLPTIITPAHHHTYFTRELLTCLNLGYDF
ncbi:hypothetical protein E2C01_034405 [Portunus trituberculatus]|uniref:Uncharacterized protein n=1 Tax=Portunus trituberculatus TaxID=210409 RepID=A0A5B7F660_PORTR|nr:hypothetical protein [Portunus trituberculatus]